MDAAGPEFPDVTLAILAGGQGRRLSGVPKGLLAVAGRTVLERLLSQAPRFGDVLLVANVHGGGHGAGQGRAGRSPRGAGGGAHAVGGGGGV
jgi:molybdopterin-guanine dinucleotide biosynthesis protein A